jgi:hypothetical protein
MAFERYLKTYVAVGHGFVDPIQVNRDSEQKI